MISLTRLFKMSPLHWKPSVVLEVREGMDGLVDWMDWWVDGLVG